MGKKIVNAKADSKGNIEAVQFAGNTTFTPQKTAVKMAERGEIDNAHAVHTKSGSHLRSNPDQKKGNNLDEMAGDNK